MNDPTKDQAIEAAIVGTKAALSLVPGGGILSLLLDYYLPNTWQRQTDKFLSQLREGLEQLKSQISQDRLESESFHLTMIKVVREALAEPREEKREAFRAILLNEAISKTQNSEIDLFIKITDDLTHTHIQALRVLANPGAICNTNPAVKNAISLVTATNRAQPATSDISSLLLGPILPDVPHDHWVVILDGLSRFSLINEPGTPWGGGSPWKAPMQLQHILVKRTTDLGDRYIRFITLPLE